MNILQGEIVDNKKGIFNVLVQNVSITLSTLSDYTHKLDFNELYFGGK